MEGLENNVAVPVEQPVAPAMDVFGEGHGEEAPDPLADFDEVADQIRINTEVDELTGEEFETIETLEEEDVENDIEEPEDFDLDELEFEEPSLYVVNDYNLEKFKDHLAFDNPEAMAVIQNATAKLKEHNFTQDQVDMYVQDMIDINNRHAGKEKPSVETIKAKLAEKLSTEEKRNYKAVTQWVKDNVAGTELTPLLRDAMSNPNIVKFMNQLYKNAIGNTPVVPQQQKQKTVVSVEEAVAHVHKWLPENAGKVTRKEQVEHIKALRNKISQNDLGQFDEIFSSILNYK